MDHTPYYSDKRSRTTDLEQAGQVSRTRYQPAWPGYYVGDAVGGGSSADAGSAGIE